MWKSNKNILQQWRGNLSYEVLWMNTDILLYLWTICTMH